MIRAKAQPCSPATWSPPNGGLFSLTPPSLNAHWTGLWTDVLQLKYVEPVSADSRRRSSSFPQALFLKLRDSICINKKWRRHLLIWFYVPFHLTFHCPFSVDSYCPFSIGSYTSLLNLTESFIIPHLAATRYVMQCPSSRSYPQGEYSHGVLGINEGIASFFRIPKNEKIIFNILEFLSKPHKVANKMLCPFGCGVKYSRCQCRGNINQLQKLIPPKEASILLNNMKHLFVSRKHQLD